MKEYKGEAVINENFDNIITIIGIEATSEEEASRKIVELVAERRPGVDVKSDTIDVLSVELIK